VEFIVAVHDSNGYEAALRHQKTMMLVEQYDWHLRRTRARSATAPAS
jgi:hypothetical protein